jgi:RNA polymerase sigma-70 factor (ECF subfamily)
MDNDRKEQFSRIYDEYIQKIYRFVYLKVNSQEVAEDITSKAFTKAWESYNRDNCQIGNLSAFLYKIASNLVVDHYRQKGRTKTVSSEALPELASKDDSLESQAILSADINSVKKALSKLKKEHQDVIIWHYLNDMPIKEIAQLIDKPEGTVRVILHRGLKELKGVIEQV